MRVRLRESDIGTPEFVRYLQVQHPYVRISKAAKTAEKIEATYERENKIRRTSHDSEADYKHQKN